MSATGFECQLNNQAEKNAFQTLELRTRMAESGNDIARAFEKYLKKNPEAKNFEWVVSLRDAVMSYADTKDEDDYLSVKDYLKTIIGKYKGSVLLFGNMEPKGLSQFSEEELLAPHMSWIKEVDSKYHEFRASFPDMRPGACLVMAQHSNIGKLSIQELYDLYKQFTAPEENYAVGMDFNDWVGWYVESKAKFDAEEKLLPEIASRMFKTLTAWKKNSLEDSVYWLNQNYEIHPMHEERMMPWIAESLEVIEKNTSEQEIDTPEL